MENYSSKHLNKLSDRKFLVDFTLQLMFDPHMEIPKTYIKRLGKILRKMVKKKGNKK